MDGGPIPIRDVPPLAGATALGCLLAFASGSPPGAWRRSPRAWLAVTDRGLARLVLTRRGYVAITLGRMVVATRRLSPAERRHESAHLEQYWSLGWRFLPRYLWCQIRHGYWNNPFEVAARAAETAGPDHLPVG